MTEPEKRRTFQSSRATAAAATSAVSLSLLTAIQEEVQAQNPQFQQNQQPNVQRVQFTDNDALTKYFTNGYDYTDALVLAKFWGADYTPQRSKIALGHIMLNEGPREGAKKMRIVRDWGASRPINQLPFDYTEAGYRYQDAEALARFWGTRDVTEAKITMIRLLAGGHEEAIQGALRQARGGQ